MNVNDMVAALAAKTVDAMINIEPYNAIAEAEGIGTIDRRPVRDVDTMPVFMAATPGLPRQESRTRSSII